MKFEDLKLSYGYSLQLQTANSAGQPERYSSRLIGCLPGRSILVSVPKSGGRLARFRSGQKLVVRFMIENGVGVFVALVEIQTTEPYPILHISYPESVNFKGIRNATRVAVDLLAQVTNKSKADAGALGRVTDISISGLRIGLDQAGFDIGDELEVTIPLDVNGLKRMASLAGVVRSQVNPAEPEDGGEFSYGIEFTELSEEHQLLIYAYVCGQIVQQDSSGNL